jgi:hypothetical protein
MSVRYRRMRTSDVDQCVSYIARHPLLGPRYGSAIGDLSTAWRQLLGSESFLGLVCEDLVPVRRIIGCYVCAFITDQFAEEITTPPLFWVGASLVNRVMGGNSPLLTDAQVRDDNSVGGLNLLIWPSAPAAEVENRIDVRQMSQTTFFNAYRGYLLKRLNAQAASPMEITMALNSGGWCLQGTDGQAIASLPEPAETFIRKPHMLQVTREMALRQMGTWVSHFFYYQRPQFGLARGEQRLLAAALHGGTDAELADDLQVSLSAIKKTWSSIYRRVAPHEELLHFGPDSGIEGDRGREKKHKIIAYIREHPEELRPVSLKLLEQASEVA